jgi:hypothetical protein
MHYNLIHWRLICKIESKAVVSRRSVMKPIASAIHAFALALALAASLAGSDFSEHFIAARAGMLNYLEGSPSVFKGTATKEELLVENGQVHPGDRLRTGEHGRVELLLNPGSYLRLGYGSELGILETKFEDMHFELLAGSAIVESAALNRKVHTLRARTPAGEVMFEKAGLYRLEVTPTAVYVAVRQGRAKWIREGVEIAALKSGKRFLLEVPAPGAVMQFAKLDKKGGDELDRWSRRRAEYLVAANSRLAPWMATSLSDRYQYSQRGGWMFNSLFGCYTFVPFDATFGSPYGYRYGLFLPVRFSRSAQDYGWTSAGSPGYSRYPGAMTTSDQRSAAASAPSAPAARVETGAADQQSRSSTFGRIRNE